ncbi:hypothetical protein BJ875DRAFT_443401 [Amylocarpus encephaloides]|uniref:Zn(2)-C6 fungal-type domain-containing protein n=1 Tax=Amylocarpus encephaloides TaxID=45428 RepID=A0A9P7YF24_9HELO|nr:hypothetical protein BJ875DRAFT_443401 [Amylocarpus encephaloides]
MQQDRGIGYRRNGKKQACEPCRKGKLACDHGVPHCGRCVRRRTTQKCIYHPAPMTRVRTSTPSHSSLITESTANSPMTAIQQPFDRLKASEARGPILKDDVVSPQSERSPTCVPTPIEDTTRKYKPPAGQYSHDDSWKTKQYPRSSQYQGPTSFSAVFSDDTSQDVLDIGEDTRKHPGAWPFGQPLHGRYRPNAPDVRRMEVVKALWNIPPRETCKRLLSGPTLALDITISQFMAEYCLETLWSNFGSLLEHPLTAENLGTLADVLFKNEERPLPPSPVDGIEWLNTFTGPHIRIEMIGVLFCGLGKAYLHLQDWDPLFSVPDNYGRNRKETAWRMTECADVCRKMCHMSETVNEIVSCLVNNLVILESATAGAESYLARSRHGDAVTCAITAGLHRLPDNANSRITTASECKRRIFASIYYRDKSTAALNGTPPMLGRLYCDVKPCLDISEEQLFSPPHELSLVISRLSADGWNTDGQLYGMTLCRGIWKLAAIREEILELALGTNVLISGELIADIHRRCEEVMNNLPEQLLFLNEDRTPKESTGHVLFYQARVMLDFLQNKFLLERVALARGFPHLSTLLCTAMENLEVVLMFWMKRDQLLSYTGYFDWIVCIWTSQAMQPTNNMQITFYGIPSAGTICVELLKKNSVIHHFPAFPRSDAIQKLTLFIGFLEWIRPTDGNYKLAGRLKKVIRKVLDHVLEPPHSDLPSPESQYDPTLLEMDNLNDMDWLNTIDWTHGSWIGL